MNVSVYSLRYTNLVQKIADALLTIARDQVPNTEAV